MSWDDPAYAPVPAPRRGGARFMCPMIDFEATEHGVFRMCYWRRRMGPGAERSYRRHWRRKHWYPFVTGTHAIMDEIQRRRHGGAPR